MKKKKTYKKEMITLLGSIYINNEATNARIMELFTKMADGEEETEFEFKVGDKVKRKDNGKVSTVKYLPGDEEYDKQNYTSPEKGMVIEAEDGGEHWRSRKDYEKIEKGEGDTMEFTMDPLSVKELYKMASAGLPALKKGKKKIVEDTSDEKIEVTGGTPTVPEKVWCGVCKKEHTKGTHD